MTRIAALALRPPGAAAPVAVDGLRLLDDTGIEGDRHADRFSPRQLLLAGAPAYARLALAPHALRENLLLDFDPARFASGTVLAIGPAALVRVMFACEACARLDLRQRGLARQVEGARGMLARVVRGGDIASGDRVRDLGPLLPAWPADWRERVVRVLDALPRDCVVDYARLARLAGIQSSYCRAFPRLLRALGPRYAGKALAAGAEPARPRWSGAGLFDPTPAQRLLLASA